MRLNIQIDMNHVLGFLDDNGLLLLYHFRSRRSTDTLLHDSLYRSLVFWQVVLSLEHASYTSINRPNLKMYKILSNLY